MKDIGNDTKLTFYQTNTVSTKRYFGEDKSLLVRQIATEPKMSKQIEPSDEEFLSILANICH